MEMNDRSPSARQGQLIRRHERGDATRWSYVAPGRVRALLGPRYIHVLRYLSNDPGTEAVIDGWIYRWHWAPDDAPPEPMLRLVSREDVPAPSAVEALPALAVGDEVVV